MADSLRSKVIRLAFDRPDLRTHLLPLLAAEARITPEYLKALADYAEKHEDPVAYAPRAANVLRGMIRSLELGNITPFPVSELWDYLARRYVDEAEITPLKKVPVPRSRVPRRVPFIDAMRQFEQVAGKNVAYSLWLDDPNVDQWSAPLLLWAKAIRGLSRYPKTRALYQSEVQRITVADKSLGSEDASWRAGGVLHLSLKAGSAASVESLVHEMGHAFEDKLGLTITAWNSIYGSPPYGSSYAEMNAAEDFAETFRMIQTEPAALKQKAPAKYLDMKARLR